MASHGKFYELAKRGDLWILNTAAAGVVIPAEDTTAPTFGVLNGAGSGVDLVLQRLAAGFVDTTGAAGTFYHMIKSGAPATPATGTVVSAMTEGEPVNAYFGAGNSKPDLVQCFPATATISAAGTLLEAVGISETVVTAADATNLYSKFVDDIEGRIVIPPGCIYYVCGSASMLSKLNLSLMFEVVAA